MEINLTLGFKYGSTKALFFQERYWKNALIAQNTFPYVYKVSKAVLNNKERKKKYCCTRWLKIYTLKKGTISEDVTCSDNGTALIDIKMCAHLNARFK